jgi:tetratricopeptide (TPR) repeat protein
MPSGSILPIDQGHDQGHDQDRQWQHLWCLSLFCLLGFPMAFCGSQFVQASEVQTPEVRTSEGPSGKVPSGVYSIRQKAHRAFQAGQYREAELLWRQVVNQSPKSAEAYYQLGLSLHLQEEVGSAIAAYRKAIALDPKYHTPYINLGLALIELNQFDEAIRALQKVLTFPDQPETPASTHALAHYNLAIIYKRQNKIQQAQQETQAALTLAPNFEAAQTLRQQLNVPQPE